MQHVCKEFSESEHISKSEHISESEHISDSEHIPNAMAPLCNVGTRHAIQTQYTRAHASMGAGHGFLSSQMLRIVLSLSTRNPLFGNTSYQN